MSPRKRCKNPSPGQKASWDKNQGSYGKGNKGGYVGYNSHIRDGRYSQNVEYGAEAYNQYVGETFKDRMAQN